MQVAQQSLHEYQHHIGHASEDAVCDRCLQPIDQATYNLNVERLQVCQLCSVSADWLWRIFLCSTRTASLLWRLS